MDGVSYDEALAGLAVSTAFVWGAIFLFAWSRRRFGGSAGTYLVAFACTWAATVAFFVLLTLWER